MEVCKMLEWTYRGIMSSPLPVLLVAVIAVVLVVVFVVVVLEAVVMVVVLGGRIDS